MVFLALSQCLSMNLKRATASHTHSFKHCSCWASSFNLKQKQLGSQQISTSASAARTQSLYTYGLHTSRPAALPIVGSYRKFPTSFACNSKKYVTRSQCRNYPQAQSQSSFGWTPKRGVSTFMIYISFQLMPKFRGENVH